MTKPCRILIVDDLAADRALLRVAIADVGWHADVTEVAHGAQVMPTLRQMAATHGAPDLVIMDHRLQGETSDTVITRIRAHEPFKNLPIIVMSTTALAVRDREQVYHLGVLKIIIKAFSYKSLVTIVSVLKKTMERGGDLSRGGSVISDSDLELLSESEGKGGTGHPRGR